LKTVYLNNIPRDQFYHCLFYDRFMLFRYNNHLTIHDLNLIDKTPKFIFVGDIVDYFCKEKEIRFPFVLIQYQHCKSVQWSFLLLNLLKGEICDNLVFKQNDSYKNRMDMNSSTFVILNQTLIVHAFHRSKISKFYLKM
jgi:hypothetical protein